MPAHTLFTIQRERERNRKREKEKGRERKREGEREHAHTIASIKHACTLSVPHSVSQHADYYINIAGALIIYFGIGIS